MRTRKEHEVPVSAERLWSLLFDPEFDRRHSLEANGMRGHQTISADTTSELWEIHSRATPRVKLPGFLERLLDGEVSFDVTLKRARGATSGECHMAMNLVTANPHIPVARITQSMTMGYRIEIVPIDAARCRRVIEWEVRITGPGFIAERLVMKEVAKAADALPEFVAAYERGAALDTTQHSTTQHNTTLERVALAKTQLRSQVAAEINLTEHCNLKCAGCNHASHQLPKKFASLTQVRRDLEALASVMHLEELKLVGGEPLLHPELSQFIAMARATQVAEELTLVTNGVLLHKLPESIYEGIDRLWISVYPGVKVQFQLDQVRRLCDKHDVLLWYKDTPEFQLTHLNQKNHDARLVERIYSQCAYAREWSCHTIHEGKYYKCSPAPFVAPRLALLGQRYPDSSGDGVTLHDNPHLAEQLDAYLDDTRPLPACSYCLGSLGREVPAHQLNRAGLAAELAEDHRDVASLLRPERATLERVQ